MDVQAVVLDFDGVIADTEPIHFGAFRQVLAGAGYALTLEDYTDRYLGFDDDGAFRAVASDQGRPLTLEDVLPMKQICFWGGSAPASVHQPGRVWELSQTDPVFLHIIRSRNLACPYGT